MITTLIFDFAGVVSRKRFFPVVAENLSKKYGLPEEDIARSLKAHTMQYMLGKESTRDFWKKVCGEFNIPYEEFVEVFSSSYDLNSEVIDLIRNLKPKYRIFLHSDNFNALSQTLRKNPKLEGLFEKMYFSDEMHLIKEDEASFRHVLRDIRKEAGECVFIDDQEINFVAAKHVGMQTILFKDANLLKEELLRLGVQS